MSRLIYLIRHPKPMVSEGICYGQTDLAPDPLALEQLLHRLHRELPSETLLVTSPLQRCKLTSDRLPALGFSSPAVDPRIAEFDFGHWEGLSWQSIDPIQREQWARDRIGYQVPGGESVTMLGQRACAALEHWQAHEPDRPIGFVTHAGVIQVLLAQLREGDFRHMRNGRIEYGSITTALLHS